MVTTNPQPNSIRQPEDTILTEIWDLIWRQEAIRSQDMSSFSVSVEDGMVFLSGHISKAYNLKLIEDLALSVPEVIAVDNQLVVDDDLRMQVVHALSRDERTLPFVIPVGVAHGWVRLGGQVPTRELQLDAEEVAGAVPTVRGVVSLPKVAGERGWPERRALQPRIQSKMYDYHKQEGTVTQVVIQPKNRLVTHAVARVDDSLDGKYRFHEVMVPVEGMEVVNKESIFLKRNGPPLTAFPAFEPTHSPLAPLDWQPPYPYVRGIVRWPCEK